MDITKALIPAAGFGTRFLPATKAVPKEMLPLIDKPAIQYIVEEGLASAINQFFIITSKEKGAIANHFDTANGLETLLKEKGKEQRIASINKIMRQANFVYIRQPEPLGLGHALMMARNIIGKEYFGVMLPDDIIMGTPPGLDQLIKVARQEKASVIAVQEVPLEQISAYGVINIKKQITPNLFQVGHLVEKPSAKDAPSNLAIVGRYILSHKIFDALEAMGSYAEGELQLTDAMVHMMSNNEKVVAYKIQGQRYDTGTPIGWLKANICLGLQHPEYGPQLRKAFAECDMIDLKIGKTTSML